MRQKYCLSKGIDLKLIYNTLEQHHFNLCNIPNLGDRECYDHQKDWFISHMNQYILNLQTIKLFRGGEPIEVDF